MRNRPLFYMLLFLILPITIVRISLGNRARPADSLAARASSDLYVTGIVTGRVDGAYRTQYTLDRVIVHTENGEIPAGKVAGSALRLTTIPIGSEVVLRGRFSLPEHARNPGAFDEHAYDRCRGIFYKLEIEEICEVRGRPDRLKEAMLSLRESCGRKLERLLPEMEAGIAKTMLLGEKGAIDSEVRQLYADHGIAHVLAISGLHINLLGLGFYELLRKIPVSHGCAGVLTLLLVALFGLFSGFSVSFGRAFLMMGIFLFGQMNGRSADTLTSAAMAAGILLLNEPYALLDVGFQLSFGATFGMAMIRPAFETLRIPEALKMSLAVELALLPILLRQYAVIAPAGILLNLAVIPLMSVLLLVLAAGLFLSFLSMGAAGFLLGTATGILKLYTFLCKLIDVLPGSLLVTGAPAMWKIILYLWCLIGGCFLLKKAKEQKKGQQCKTREAMAGLVLLMVGCVLLCLPGKQKGLKITAMDVSQGDGFLIQADGVNVLIDGGSSTNEDVGADVMRPVLRTFGVSHISCAVISHWDADHCNGLLALLDENWLRVDEVILPAVNDSSGKMKGLRKLKDELTALGVPYRTMSAGESFVFGDLYLHCIYPQEGATVDNANDASLSLRLDYRGFSMIFAGDLGGAKEGELTKYPGDVTMIKATHHGSEYSNTPVFLDWADPKLCVISCGRENPYGHPHEAFLKRLSDRNILQMQTAKAGAVICETDGDEVTVYGWLPKSPHFSFSVN